MKYYVTARTDQDFFYDDPHEILLAGPFADRATAVAAVAPIHKTMRRRAQHETDLWHAGKPNDANRWHRYTQFGVLALLVHVRVHVLFSHGGAQSKVPVELDSATRFPLR